MYVNLSFVIRKGMKIEGGGMKGGGLKFFPRFLGGYEIVYLKFHLSSTPL